MNPAPPVTMIFMGGNDLVRQHSGFAFEDHVTHQIEVSAGNHLGVVLAHPFGPARVPGRDPDVVFGLLMLGLPLPLELPLRPPALELGGRLPERCTKIDEHAARNLQMLETLEQALPEETASTVRAPSSRCARTPPKLRFRLPGRRASAPGSLTRSVQVWPASPER